jgi:hypothetical protein
VPEHATAHEEKKVNLIEGLLLGGAIASAYSADRVQKKSAYSEGVKLTRRSLLAAFVLGLSLMAMPCRAGATYITAAINWPGGKAQFFLSDGTYIRYDVASDQADPGYPKAVTNSTWPGMGGYGGQIIAAASSLDSRKAYFFLANGSYIRYDIASDRADSGYPQPITDKTWPGLGPYATLLYGALNWSDNKLYFFLSDGSYIRYDLKADRVDAGYPQPITKATWPGLAMYASHIAGSINWSNGKAYIFFDDGRYVRYDIGADHVDEGYPQPINSKTWPGLYTFFRRP